MVSLNSTLIIYEIALVIRDHSIVQTTLPIWYIYTDIAVTAILFIEMAFAIAAIHDWIRRWESWIDLLVLFLSIACCVAYLFDLENANIDNLTMLFVRICRDLIRVVRCVWFFKMLYS